ncbi:hypothetical protein BVRB_7g176590 [Beta vulgaris subsp. vulgaris]|nr:hypothetical protein BVRB_7g176590 [Beta vulgaris subsp. vulgaris]
MSPRLHHCHNAPQSKVIFFYRFTVSSSPSINFFLFCNL